MLPFEDLSADKGSAFLADGVQDEVLTDLAKVADLKVISRSSVMQYQAGAPRNLHEIAGLLGVAYVVEGSVQRDGKRVRVNARLVDPRTDATPWAEHYDRSLEDVFALQSDIAEAIAHQLQIRISPEEKSAIEAPATADLQAYDQYLRARYIYQAGAATWEKLPEAARLLDDAVTRDPKFLRAWCLLADAHGAIYGSSAEPAPAQLTQAQAALQRAQALAPDAGEVHRSLGIYALRCAHDPAQALAELEAAQRFLPNDATVYLYLSQIEFGANRGEEGLRDLEHAFELDPRNLGLVGQLAATYRNWRRFEDEVRVLDRFLALKPGDPEMRLERALAPLYAAADSKPYQTTLAAVLTEDPTKGPDLIDPDDILCLRTPDGAALLLANYPREQGAVRGGYPYAYWEGVVARWQGDAARARAAFTVARAEMAKDLTGTPDDPDSLTLLGIIDAGLGNKAEALAEGRRACELRPISQGPFLAWVAIKNLAQIEAWTGEKAAAVEHLESLRTTHCFYYNYGLLKLHPIWDDLRGNPRFEALLVSLAPKE